MDMLTEGKLESNGCSKCVHENIHIQMKSIVGSGSEANP